MTWLSVEIELPPELEPEDERFDVMSALLFELGAEGLEVKDEQRPIVVVAAFAPDPELDPTALAGRVQDSLRANGIEAGAVRPGEFEAIDWAAHWKRHFAPICFGAIWVVPSWLAPPETAGAVLWIDPSMAFGTGLHATTALCLERIGELSPVGSLLDVGTGTGILALGALRLGTRRAVGVDNDPDALTVARENAVKNALSLELIDELPDERFDLVVANILAGPLIELAPEIASRVAPGGRLLLSGVLGSQAEEVSGAYEREGLALEAIVHRDEWVRIDLVLDS